VAIEQNGPARGNQEFGEEVEKRGLAGPVGSNQGVDLASANANGYVIDGHKALELFDEPTCLQNDVISHGYL
jgi:hypothetical protein